MDIITTVFDKLLSDTGLICIFAFLGPIMGIQLQKYLERGELKRQRKGEIFRVLLNSLNSEYGKTSEELIKALNLLLVDFSDANKVLQNAINDVKEHLLSDPNTYPHGVWLKLRDVKFDTLLKEVAKDYDKSLVNNDKFETFFYDPNIQKSQKLQERVIREKLCEILSGNQSLNITVTNLPTE
tara:strand:+ start:530 stop:1078 length:549 start_codon:yes stop_codon:yes gene_type:complete